MSRRIEGLHVAALAVLAFAQPLFDVLGRNGEFFIASRTSPLELLLLVGVFVVAVPAALVLVETTAGLIGAGVRRGAHLAIVAGLLAIIALPMLGRLWSGPGPLVVAGAALVGALGAEAYRRAQAVRLLLSFLSIAILVVPANFLLNSDARTILFPAEVMGAGGVTVETDTPVVLLILDELPLASLLDEHLEIDDARYPNFARLASTATWFRNATSVSDGTIHAVPAILTGRYPRKELLPTAGDHPDNLFTLLGGSYELRVQEPVTSLCPEGLCADGAHDATLRMFLADTTVVLAHTLLPASLATGLPPIDRTWRGFAGSQPTPHLSLGEGTDEPDGRSDRGTPLDVEITSDRRVLYAVHLMLPHVPWRFLPGGHRYGRTRDIPGLAAQEQWTSNQNAVLHAYQRHLLQVGYADRVLGDVMRKLEDAGIDDDALVIVASDHGCSFHAGDSRRHMTKTNWADILRVPLLVKFPGQTRAVVTDRPVQSIDILPTIADVLDVALRFPVDGRSLRRDRDRSAKARMALGHRIGEFSPPDDLSGLLEAARRKTALFGAGGDTRKLFGPGTAWTLVGERIADLSVVHPGDITAVLTEPEQFANVRPDLGVVPALISGVVSGPGLTAADTAVAVAVNGIVRAVTPLARFGEGARFRTMVPESSFGHGSNDVEVLVIDGTARRRVRSASLAVENYRLSAADGTERLETGSGHAIALEPGRVRGTVDKWSETDLEDYLSIWGWAADLTHAGLPAVLVFADGKYVASTGPTADRPDVARTFQDDELLRSGYVIRIPWSDVQGAQRIRLFGVSSRGVASELDYARGFPYGPDVERIPVPGLRSILVRPGAVQGYVDAWSRTASGDRVSIAGWVADLRHAGPPKVLVLADDRVVATIVPTIERPDVARALENEAALLSGFGATIPLSALGGARRIRVLGVSSHGTASELAYPAGFPGHGPAAAPTQ